MSRLRSMVTSPPKISTMTRADVASVVRCGSSVGGSTKSCTRRSVLPPVLSVSSEAVVSSTVDSAAASVGATVGSAGVGLGPESPPQANRSINARNSEKIPRPRQILNTFIPVTLLPPFELATLRRAGGPSIVLSVPSRYYRAIVGAPFTKFQIGLKIERPRFACNRQSYLLALKYVASVAEWSRRLSVAQEITGSNPVARPKQRRDPRHCTLLLPAPVAQWIEHWASDPGVAGSNPAGRAKSLNSSVPLSCLLYAGTTIPDSSSLA